MLCRALLAGLSVALVVPAGAVELLAGASVRYQYSDNILQANEDEQSEEMIAPRVDTVLVKEAGPVRGAAVLFAEHADYRDNLLDDETRYNLTTGWSADLVENRLVWRFEDVAQRRIIDARDLDIADNRVDQNYLDTGPDLFLSLTRRDELVVSARYSQAWYGDDIDFDSERYLGGLEARHQMSPLNTLLASYRFSTTEYTERNVPGFDREESLVGLARALTRVDWRIEVGHNKVSLENGERYEGAVGNLSWRQQWRDGFTTRLRAEYRLTDAAEQVIDDVLAGGLDLDPIVTTDVYTLRAAGLVAEWQRARWQLWGGVRAEQQDYEIQILDQHIVAAEIGVTRSVSAQTRLGLAAERVRRDFVDIDRLDHELEMSLRLDHVFSGLFYGAIGVIHERGDSNAPFTDFRENIAFVEFGLRGSLLARDRGDQLRFQGMGVN